MDVVKIPLTVDRSSVSARVLYKNGAVSDAIPLFVDWERHYATTRATTDQAQWGVLQHTISCAIETVC
jgi:hypothetical protein